MGENVSGRKTVSYQGHDVTPEILDLFERSSEDYGKSGFDDIGESKASRVLGVTFHLRGRIGAFLKSTKDGGILLGPVVDELKKNLDEISQGRAPTAPQANEPGGGLVKAGGYAAWFAHTVGGAAEREDWYLADANSNIVFRDGGSGNIEGWYQRRARNLIEKVIGKYNHVFNLEKLPEKSELEKLPEEKFIELYGKSKEKYLQDDGALFEEKEGVDKLGLLRRLDLKRLIWEEGMVLKDTVDYIYGCSDKPKTSLGIVSHVSGISCGDSIDPSIVDEGTWGGSKAYWDGVDKKLKYARFMTDEEFEKTWKVSKKAFINELVPELHALYTKVIAQKIAGMDMKELKDRYYLSDLRGDELLGELLGGTHSAAKDIAYLESCREKLGNLKAGLSMARDRAEVKFSENEKARSARLTELKEKQLKLERANPELAAVAGEIFLDKSQNRETAPKGLSNLKCRRDNTYLIYTDYRNELKDEKKHVDALAEELVNLKNALRKTDISSLEVVAVKGLLDTLHAKNQALTGTENRTASPLRSYSRERLKTLNFLSKPPKRYLEAELKPEELEGLEARWQNIKGKIPRDAIASSAIDKKEAAEKWEAYQQKIAELEKTVLPEIDAAKGKWKARAISVIENELGKQIGRSGRLSSDIENIENEVAYFEKKLGIKDYRMLETRQKGMESEFPGADAKSLVIRKLAFDALAKAEETLGKEECWKLEERRKELRENPSRDPVFREAVLKEIGTIEETLGIAPYKKLEARRKEIDSELEKRPESAEYKLLKERKEELEGKIRKAAKNDRTLTEYKTLEAEEKKLDGRISELEERAKKLKDVALAELEPLEKELGLTGYTDIEAGEKRLQERIDELKKIQKIPEEIDAKRKEIADKECYLEGLEKDVGEIETRFGIPRYADWGDMAGRIKYLKENLPRDPVLRKLALNGITSPPELKGGRAGLNGLSVIEDNLWQVGQRIYEKSKLEGEIKGLEDRLPEGLQLELKEIERLENINEERRLALVCEAKREYNAQGLKEIESLENAKEELKLARENWMATHGVAALEKWKEEHGVNAYKGLVDEARAIETERANEGWARTQALDALVEFGKKMDSVDQELKYLKISLEDKRQPEELRDALLGKGKYSPRRLFSYDALAKNNDTSEFRQLLKQEFDIELAGDIKVKKDKKSAGLRIISGKSSHKIFLQPYNQNRGVRLQIEEAGEKHTRIKTFLSRTDRKTGELVVEDYPVSMNLFNRLYREVKSGLSEELKEKVRTAGKNIKKRDDWLSSHPNSADWDEVFAQRKALEFEVLAPGRLFSYDAIEKNGDISEFRQYMKQKFGVELAEGATVTKGQDGALNVHSENLPPISLLPIMARHGVLLQIGDDPNKKETVIAKLTARKNPETKELIVFPDEKRDALAKRVLAAWNAKVEGKTK